MEICLMNTALMNYEGMIDGIEILTKNFDDTKLISYLATNNTIKNELNLKALSSEFAGNYAEDNIKDTSKISIDKLLKYNLKDTLSTWFAYHKYHPVMIKDQQETIYLNLFKPSVKTLLQTELCGLPISPNKIQIAKNKLLDLQNKYDDFFLNSNIIKKFHDKQLIKRADKFTEKAKQKV